MKTKFRQLINRPELIFLIIASVFGALSVFLMPILETPDENYHFRTSYAIFSSHNAPGRDLVYRDGIMRSQIQQEKYDEFFTERTSAEKDGVIINTLTTSSSGQAKASIFDVMHIPQAFGVLMGRLIYPSVGLMVIMGRLFNLAFYIFVLYLIIKSVPVGKWVFVMIACLPMMIQQAASLSYDPINLLSIFAWVAYIIMLATTKKALTSREAFVGLALLFFLSLTKSNNLILSALVLAVPAVRITKTHVYQTARSCSWWWLVKYGTILLSVMILVLGTYFVGEKLLAGHSFIPQKLASVLMNTFVWGDLALIDATTVGLVGQFANFAYHLPTWLVVVTLTILVLVMLSEKAPSVSKRFASISALLFIGSILLISTGMYYAWALKSERLGVGANIADGIQGRYFTPLLVLAYPSLAYLQRTFSITTRNKMTVPLLVIFTSLSLLTLYIVITFRYYWR